MLESLDWPYQLAKTTATCVEAWFLLSLASAKCRLQLFRQLMATWDRFPASRPFFQHDSSAEDSLGWPYQLAKTTATCVKAWFVMFIF